MGQHHLMGRFRRPLMNLLLFAIGAASLGADGCKGCNNCPQNENLEVTAWTASDETLYDERIPPDKTLYCYTSRGWQPFPDAPGSSGVLNTIYLEEVEPGPNGEKQYTSIPLAPSDLKDSGLWYMWLQCAHDTNVVRYDVDLSHATPEGESFIGGARALSPYEKLKSTDFDLETSVKNVGICVRNNGGNFAVLEHQSYLPTLECASAAPPQVPESGGREISCKKPDPPKPPPTCSGQDGSNAALWLVPVTDPYTECGDALVLRANSLSEAQGCAQSAGLETPAQVCQYEIHLYSEPDLYVYKAAEGTAAAVECAKNTECSGCAPYVTQVGICANAGGPL